MTLASHRTQNLRSTQTHTIILHSSRAHRCQLPTHHPLHNTTLPSLLSPPPKYTLSAAIHWAVMVTVPTPSLPFPTSITTRIRHTSLTLATRTLHLHRSLPTLGMSLRLKQVLSGDRGRSERSHLPRTMRPPGTMRELRTSRATGEKGEQKRNI